MVPLAFAILSHFKNNGAQALVHPADAAMFLGKTKG